MELQHIAQEIYSEVCTGQLKDFCTLVVADATVKALVKAGIAVAGVGALIARRYSKKRTTSS